MSAFVRKDLKFDIFMVIMPMGCSGFSQPLIFMRFTMGEIFQDRMSALHTLEGLMFVPLMISTGINAMLFVVVAHTISPLSSRVCDSKT